MSRGPTLADLVAALDAGRIVPLADEDWRDLRASFTLVDDIDTGLGGRILLVRRPLPQGRRKGWALVEEPRPGEKVIRPLADEAGARALIADRLAAYERMWDG
ncbi:hypothetical protein KDM41_02325 [bacterium]|nr:hypothetical protein [bacterium]